MLVSILFPLFFPHDFRGCHSEATHRRRMQEISFGTPWPCLCNFLWDHWQIGAQKAGGIDGDRISSVLAWHWISWIEDFQGFVLWIKETRLYCRSVIALHGKTTCTYEKTDTYHKNRSHSSKIEWFGALRLFFVHFRGKQHLESDISGTSDSFFFCLKPPFATSVHTSAFCEEGSHFSPLEVTCSHFSGILLRVWSFFFFKYGL